MRYISAQFETILTNNLYLENARKANTMAKLLLEKISNFKEIKITQKTEIELKAIAYDVLAQIEQGQANLRAINQELANRSAKAKLDKVAEDAKPTV